MADIQYKLNTAMGTGGKQPATFVRTGATITSAGSVAISVGESGIISAISCVPEVTDYGTCTPDNVKFAVTKSAGDAVVSMVGGDGIVTLDILIRNM